MDRDRIWKFIETFTGIAAHAGTLTLMAIADRTGMLEVLADGASLSAEEVAERGDLEHRYVVEILAGLAAGGILSYDADSRRFTLPEEHAAVIADDDSPYSMAGWLDMLPEGMAHLDAIIDATRYGGGVNLSSYSPRMIQGIDRGNGPSMTHLLARKWIAVMDDVVTKLEDGGKIADVGCGSGAALASMANAFPNSEVWGFDLDPRAVERASERAASLPNAHVEKRSATEIPIDMGFDLVTALDVVHDLSEPLESLQRMRRSLAGGGTVLMMEPRASSHLEENLHDRGALLYSVSTLHCMTQSLASGGPGLGAAWGRERAEALSREAGFERFEELPIENPFSAFYRLGG